MDLYVVTAVDKYRFRCSNVWVSEEDAKQSVKNNHFDVWEGHTNKYVVIEKMKAGQPWTCEEVVWYGREQFDTDKPEIKAHVYEIDKPKELEGICNFGVG